MTVPSSPIGRFELVTLAALRTTQLMRGCTPRVAGCSKLTTTAQREIAVGKVAGLPRLSKLGAAQ
jgi:DNA-directed RNA polymerase subunit K/omega